ncbi:MAG: TonB-dependent receptor plug domain-containing protein [Methylococcaceae bacterium]
MSFAQLSKITYSSLSLTETELNSSPYTYSYITQKMIQQSGSRSLNEVLETYVPNFQKTQSPGVLGLRGNFAGNINLGFQYMLIMVNGHARDSAQTGSRFEYDLIALEDINNIEVIRSAGSATFGPGAYAGVINITTHNADTFEGTKVTLR